MRLTDAQRAMLGVVSEFGDGVSGTAEIVLQFGCERGLPDSLLSVTADRVLGALKRKNLIVDEGDGPEITVAGDALL